MLINSEYLPVLKKAENGDVKARQEITRILASVNTPANYKLKKRYYDLIIRDYTLTDEKTDIVEVMRRRGNCDFCEKKFHDALKWHMKTLAFMIENYNPREWSMAVFDDLKLTAEIIIQEAITTNI